MYLFACFLFNNLWIRETKPNSHIKDNREDKNKVLRTGVLHSKVFFLSILDRLTVFTFQPNLWNKGSQ